MSQDEYDLRLGSQGRHQVAWRCNPCDKPQASLESLQLAASVGCLDQAFTCLCLQSTLKESTTVQLPSELGLKESHGSTRRPAWLPFLERVLLIPYLDMVSLLMIYPSSRPR